MSKQKKTNKINAGHKVTMGALGVLGIVGGWNIIGRMESAAAAEVPIVEATPRPTPRPVPPSPTPWPAIQPLVQSPRLQLEPLPAPAAGGPAGRQPTASAQADQNTAVSLDLSTLPSAAPLPTLAPLPALPEYVPPPPPPPSQSSAKQPSNGGGGGGGGNTSKGS